MKTAFIILAPMEILFLNTLNDHWRKRIAELEKEFPECRFVQNNNKDERAEALKTTDAVISGRIYKEDLDNAPKLKIVFVPFTGLDNFPVELLKQRGIKISNTHANANVVAEKAIALSLTLLGRIVEFHNELKRGYWHMSIEHGDMWASIQGKSCGILGYGHIGSHIAKFLKAFDCKVYGFKRNVIEPLTGNHPPAPLKGGQICDEISSDLTYVISKSDIIFNTLPLTDETKHIINSDVLNKMKGKYFINVGRGVTVDEDALYNALTNGTLKGAALDVWFNYPGKDRVEPTFPSNKPIYELPNVVISPHKSSHTVEAIEAMIDDTVEGVRKYILNHD